MIHQRLTHLERVRHAGAIHLGVDVAHEIGLHVEILHERERVLAAIGREEAQFEVERFWVGALRRAAVDGDVVKGSLMAGQSVGLVKEIKPLKTIIAEMVAESEAEMQRLKRLFAEAVVDRARR